MKDEDFQRLLRSRQRERSRGWRCPDDNEVAHYMNAQLIGDKKKRFESHVASCEPCRSLIGFLSTANEWPEADPVPPNVMVAARGLVVKHPVAFSWWSWPIATAVAAILVLSLAFFILRFRAEQNPSTHNGTLVAQQRPPVTAPNPIPSPSPVSQTRILKRPGVTSGTGAVPRATVRGRSNAFHPSILSPREGAVIKRGKLSFRWSESVDALFYELKLVNADGSVVFQRNNLTGTQLWIPDEVRLLRGNKYFLRVVAHTRDGRSQKSELVGFRISP